MTEPTTPPDDPGAVAPPSGDEAAQDQPAAAAPPPAPPACAECGSPLDDDQTYCLECGAPTPRAPRLRRRGAGTGVLAAGLAALGVGAGVLAAVVANDDGPAGGTTAPRTGTQIITVDTGVLTTGPLPPDTTVVTVTPPSSTVDTSTGFVTGTSGTTVTPPASTTDPPVTVGSTSDTTTTDSGSSGDPTSEWPPGRSAWTAVLASAGDGDAARRERRRARDAGFSARILLSDDHASLTPGLFVVYVGVFADHGGATAMATRARASFPGAYPRYVSG